MIAVIQRVSNASVTIEEKVHGEIGTGFLVLLGITHSDGLEDVEWLGKKIVGLRVFGDEEGKMNLDLKSVNGDILLISQFTLHASTKKGNRPSFIEAEDTGFRFNVQLQRIHVQHGSVMSVRRR